MPGRRAVVAGARFGKIEAPIFTQRMRESRIPVGGAEKPRRVLRSPGSNSELREDEHKDHEPAFHGSFLCCFTGAPGFCPGSRTATAARGKTDKSASRECRCAENRQVRRERQA